MELHSLKPAEGSNKSGKIIGRGTGSGRGRTSTRGHKGAKSRSGFKNKRNFEGGQTPLQMRLPKFGFNSPNRVEYFPINLDLLQHFSEKFSTNEITHDLLVEKRVVKKYHKIKILGRGELNSPVSVQVHAISDSAKNHIENIGGKVNLL